MTETAVTKILSKAEVDLNRQNALVMLQSDTDKDRFASVVQVIEALYNENIMLRNRDITTLGTGECFVLRDSKGEIRGFKQKVTLTEEEGSLQTIIKASAAWKNDKGYIIPAKPATVIITAQGFEKLNAAAGVSVLLTKTVYVDGKECPNPHIIYDVKTQDITKIYCQAVAYGYSDKGLPIAYPHLEILDVVKSNRSDLLKKADDCPNYFMSRPSGFEIEESRRTLFVRTPIHEGVDLLYDVSHPEWRKWKDACLKREKKVVNYAQTFAKRNASRHWHGRYKVPGGFTSWTFSVICWRPTGNSIIKWDATTFEKVQSRVTEVLNGDVDFSISDDSSMPIEIKPMTVSETEVEDIREAEAADDIEDVSEKSDPVFVEDVKPIEAMSESETADNEKVVKSLAFIKKRYTDFYVKACTQLSLAPGDHTPDDQRKILDIVQKLIAGKV